MANRFTFQEKTYSTGDTVRLHLSVTEGDKTRTQVFEGLIIAIKGSGTGKSLLVRKIATGSIGVERQVPLNSPNLIKIDKKTSGKTRRAKLYYLRSRVGRSATKVKTAPSGVKTKSDLVKKAPKKVKTSLSGAKPKTSGQTNKGPVRRKSSPKTPSK